MKIYHYEDLFFPVADETDVNFRVEFVSDGNTGLTTINVSEYSNPEIENAGTKFIGKGKDLRDRIIDCTSSIENYASEEDQIHIKYYINEQLIVDHNKSKTETKRPVIMLELKFPVL